MTSRNKDKNKYDIPLCPLGCRVATVVTTKKRGIQTRLLERFLSMSTVLSALRVNVSQLLLLFKIFTMRRMVSSRSKVENM